MVLACQRLLGAGLRARPKHTPALLAGLKSQLLLPKTARGCSNAPWSSPLHHSPGQTKEFHSLDGRQVLALEYGTLCVGPSLPFPTSETVSSMLGFFISCGKGVYLFALID